MSTTSRSMPVSLASARAALSNWRSSDTLDTLRSCLSPEERTKLPTKLISLGAYHQSDNFLAKQPISIMLGDVSGWIHVVRCLAPSEPARLVETYSPHAVLPSAVYIGEQHKCSMLEGSSGQALQSWLPQLLASAAHPLALQVPDGCRLHASVWCEAIGRDARLYEPASVQPQSVPTPATAWVSAFLAPDARAQPFSPSTCSCSASSGALCVACRERCLRQLLGFSVCLNFGASDS